MLLLITKLFKHLNCAQTQKMGNFSNLPYYWICKKLNIQFGTTNRNLTLIGREFFVGCGESNLG